VTGQSLDFIESSEPASRHPSVLLDQIFDFLQFDSKIAVFGTVIQIGPHTEPSRYSLDNYCLYENSAYGRLLSHLFPYFNAQALSMSSRIWLVLSVCPSVYGSYAELKFSLVTIDS
jgi:hypothetical protein